MFETFDKFVPEKSFYYFGATPTAIYARYESMSTFPFPTTAQIGKYLLML